MLRIKTSECSHFNWPSGLGAHLGPHFGGGLLGPWEDLRYPKLRLLEIHDRVGDMTSALPLDPEGFAALHGLFLGARVVLLHAAKFSGISPVDLPLEFACDVGPATPSSIY